MRELFTSFSCENTSSLLLLHFVFFFFQAEDGIRDYKVTGVQTCALPICIGEGPSLDKALTIDQDGHAVADSQHVYSSALRVELDAQQRREATAVKARVLRDRKSVV